MDDFGMSPSINAAIGAILEKGVIRSCSLMANANYFEDAVQRLKGLSLQEVGIHLALTSEYESIPTKPLTGLASLQDEKGYLYPDTAQFRTHAKLEDVEREVWAQIRKVQGTGLKISHIDGHMFFYEKEEWGNEDLLQLCEGVARELNLPVRSRSFDTHPEIRKIFIWDAYPTVQERTAYYDALLKGPFSGVSELILHPAIDCKELHAMMSLGEMRVADYRYFSNSDWREIAERSGVEICNWAN